jgi:hypothetical protein
MALFNGGRSLDTLAFEPTAAPLKDSANYVRDEVAKWAKIVRETGAKAEYAVT